MSRKKTDFEQKAKALLNGSETVDYIP